MRAVRPAPAFLLLFAFLSLTRPLTAQSVYGQVSGRVIAASGAPVAGASVTVTSVQTGAPAQATSDSGGYFTFSNLPAGMYQIDIQADAFERVQGTVAVSADSTTTVNSTLQTGNQMVLNVIGGPDTVGGSALSAKAERLVNTASGAPVSGASVVFTSTATGARVRATSDTNGYITIPILGEGLYKIEVRVEGFKTVQDSIGVSAGGTTTVNVPLQPGNSNELAQKSEAGASVLKLDRTDVSTLFDARAVNDLPLLDRNLTELQLLVPGAVRGRFFASFNQNLQNSLPANLNGQHSSGSAFQLDGAENREPLEGLVLINPTLDSAQEMKVTTQGYNAEFGQATAGVVTIQTRSGSNAWHGDAFGFRRTGFGQSQDPFAPGGIPPTKYNIFGGSLGGPIMKNKLFIFGDYQGTRSSQGANALLSVPPADVRSTCLGSIARGTPFCNLSDYSKFINCLPPPNQNICPLTDAEGFPFLNYQIPNTGTPNTDDHVSDQAVALLNFLPLANYTPTDPICSATNGAEAVCNNYLASGQEAVSGDQFDLRADYNVNSRLRLFGRYSFGEFHDTGTPAFGAAAGGVGLNPDGFAGIAQTRNQGLSTGFTYSLSPKLLTDFRFGYLRYRLNINAQDNLQTPDLGIPGIFVQDTHNPFATGMPDFEIPGQGGLTSGGTGDYLRLGYSSAANSCSCPLRETEQQFQFVNNWTRKSGEHIVKWGADLRYLQNYRFTSDRPTTGYFDFSPGATGLGLATLLIGDVTFFNRTLGSPAAANAGERQKRFGFYGQDTWRINSRLTLNYGLRWEIYFPQTVTGAGGFLAPNLNNNDPAATNFSGPPAGGISGNLTSVGPRLGFAYLINPTTVVRAGYGRSFDSGYAGDIFGIAATQNPPVTVNQNVVVGGFNLAQGPPLFNFPSGSRFSLLDLAVANSGNLNQIPPVPGSGAVLYALPSRVRVPTVDSWNLTFQHELTSHLYFELAYVGNKGTHFYPDSFGTYYDLNQPSLQNLIVPVMYAPNGKPIAGGCKGGKNGLFGTAPTQFCLSTARGRSFFTQVNSLPNFDPSSFSVLYFGNNANDNYNSLQVKVNKSLSRGYSFLAHYTWSKGLDYDANYFRVDPRVGYGPDSFDIRHRFVMTNIWELPVGRGKAWLGGIGPATDRFVGGWAISAITVWQSGIPFSPTYTTVNCGRDTDSGDPCRPNLVGTVHISGSRAQYFTTTGGQPLPAGGDCSANGRFCGVDAKTGQPVNGAPIGPWQRPGAGLIGTAARDSLYGPSFFQSDIGLAKAIRITERTAVRFRADAINAFNKVNLGQPNTCVDCSNGGVISSLALGALQRELQFSLRIEF